MIGLRLRRVRRATLLALLVGLVTAGSIVTPAAANDTTPSPAATTQSDELNVMTFNLRYASNTPPNAWPQRRPVTKLLLEAEAPHILGTQEGLHQQLLDILADLPEYYDSIGQGREGGTAGEAMQVFYDTRRLTALQVGHYWLSDTPDVVGSKTWGGCCPRMVTWIKFQDELNGDQFYFINTHLEAYDALTRTLSADLILQRMKLLDPNLPIVMTADFNEPGQRGGTVYDQLVTNGPLQDTWTAAAERSTFYGTFPNYGPLNPNGAKIDWILTSPGVRVPSAKINTFSSGGQFPSDHLPVQAVVDLPDVEDIQTAQVFTTPGVAPAMPSTAVPVYWDGPRGALPVTWELPGEDAWSSPRTVAVNGVATDSLGREYPAEAEVVVDTLLTTEPARAKTFAGGQPALPQQVDAVGTIGRAVARPVTWDAVPPGAFDEPGVVTLTGRADAGAGTTLPATVRVQVTAPAEENAALAAGTTSTATYTESGYSAGNLINGSGTDKGWSNWRSGPKNTSDTITITLPEERTITHVATDFYRDGRDSYPASVRIQARDAQGTWADVSGEVTVPSGGTTGPIVDVPITPTVTDAVRVVMTARTEMYITISEIMVYANTPGRSADATAAAISIDGAVLPEFGSETLAYERPVRTELPTITAVATDPYAAAVVTQATLEGRTATVAVTSEDGTQTRTYTVEFVNVDPSVTATAAPADWGTAATVSVTVAASGLPISGSVELREGDMVRGSATLSGGVATFTLPVGLALGDHAMTVAYAGNEFLNPAEAGLTVTVDGPAAWSAATIYQAGDEVTFGGQVYQASRYARAHRPGDVSGPWQLLAMTEDGVTIWTASRIFQAGDIVTHDGRIYQARVFARGQQPGAVNGPWTLIG